MSLCSERQTVEMTKGHVPTGESISTNLVKFSFPNGPVVRDDYEIPVWLKDYFHFKEITCVERELKKSIKEANNTLILNSNHLSFAEIRKISFGDAFS